MSKLNVEVVPGGIVGVGVVPGVGVTTGVGVPVTIGVGVGVGKGDVGETVGIGVGLVLEGFGVAEPVTRGVGDGELLGEVDPLGVEVGLFVEAGIVEEGEADVAGVWVGDGETDGEGAAANVLNAYHAIAIITAKATIIRMSFGQVIFFPFIAYCLYSYCKMPNRFLFESGIPSFSITKKRKSLRLATAKKWLIIELFEPCSKEQSLQSSLDIQLPLCCRRCLTLSHCRST
jgi:hypothetical protein